MEASSTRQELKRGKVPSHRILWSGIAAFLVLLGLLLAGQQYREYRRSISDTEDRLMTQARVINENLGANLTFINVLLTDIAGMLDRSPRVTDAAMNAYLRHQDDLIPGIRTIFVTDARGRITLSSNDRILGFDGSGRDYFKTAMSISDPARLLITAPFQTVLGTSVVTVTRAINGKNDQFRGVVSATLNKDYFKTLLGSVLYAPDNRVTLVHISGSVFLSLPDAASDPTFVGKNLLDPVSLFQRHIGSGSPASIQLGHSRMLGERRIAAFITCTPPDLKVEYPLVIYVSRSVDTVLAPWRRDTAVLAVLYVLMSGLIAVITIVLLRSQSEHKKAEEEHLKLRHLESLEILAGGITHDFNNLITSILGFIQIAKEASRRDDPAHSGLTIAVKNCLHAKELSQRLLAFATGGEHPRVMQTIVPLIEESVKEVVRDASIRAELSLPDYLHRTPIDEEQMRQVFLNLVTNAKDAMPDGGILIIQGDNLRVDRSLNLPLADGEYIRLTVRDTGVGIAAENLPKIFNPYFSTKDTYSQKGLGLGLAVCYSVIRRHGGLITIDSQVGAGTTITVILPAFE